MASLNVMNLWHHPPVSNASNRHDSNAEKCLTFEVMYEHFQCCLPCGVHLLPWDCLEFSQTQPPCVCSQHWEVCVFSSSFFINDVHKCQHLCLLFLAVTDTEACVIKTHQSHHYSTFICTELSGLSVNLSLI